MEARLVVTPEAMTYEGDRRLVIRADVTLEAMTYEGGCWMVRRVTVTPEAMTYEGGCYAVWRLPSWWLVHSCAIAYMMSVSS